MKAFLVLVFVSFPCFAQIAHEAAPLPAEKAKQVLATKMLPGDSCPVELSAKRSPESGFVQTSPSEKHRGQQLRLWFKPSDPRAILQADLTVYGLAGAQVIPARSRNPGRYATEMFHVAPAPGEHQRFFTTVFLERLTGVDAVQVNSLTFADGSTWHSSSTSVCRVAPDRFKLVALGN